MIPNLLTLVGTYRIASRLHVKAGRPVYAGRVAVALALAGVATAAGYTVFRAATCEPDCEHF